MPTHSTGMGMGKIAHMGTLLGTWALYAQLHGQICPLPHYVGTMCPSSVGTICPSSMGKFAHQIYSSNMGKFAHQTWAKSAHLFNLVQQIKVHYNI